jgi:hypothetical protein
VLDILVPPTDTNSHLKRYQLLPRVVKSSTTERRYYREHIHPRSSPAIPTSFFDLPRELRDQIYDFAWQANTTRLVHVKRCIISEAIYPLAKSLDHQSVRGLPLWLLTCKATLEEGLEQLALGGSIEIAPVATKYDIATLSPLLKPTSYREIIIELPSNPEVPTGKSTPAVIGYSYPKTWIWCHDLLVETSKLKHLRLQTTTRASDGGLDHRVDLAPLGKAVEPVAQQLSRLELVMKIKLSDRGPMRTMVDDRLREQMQILDQGVLAGMKGAFERLTEQDQWGRVWHCGWRVVWTRG